MDDHAISGWRILPRGVSWQFVAVSHDAVSPVLLRRSAPPRASSTVDAKKSDNLRFLLTGRQFESQGFASPLMTIVHCPGDHLPDHAHRAVSPWSEPGKLPGSHARLPQLGQNGAFGLDHQGGQPPGALPVGPGGPAPAAPGSNRTGLVSADQTASRREHRAGGGDAADGHDPLADAQYRRALAAESRRVGDTDGG